MLILAGVSLNAIIGDNGIINNAQETKILQSCAEISEYLNTIYVDSGADENVDVADKTPLEILLGNSKSSNWFYRFGPNNYVVIEYTDNSGNVKLLKIHLLKKSNFVKDYNGNIVGGDALGEKDDAYRNLEDVYGVTSNLKIFYCKNGILSAVGADFSVTSELKQNAVLYQSDSSISNIMVSNFGGESNNLTVQDLRRVSKITITERQTSNLKFLYDMPNLKEITFQNYIGSLDGIEGAYQLERITFNNNKKITDINYIGLSKLNKSLNYLYFYYPDDIQVDKLMTEMGKGNYPNLEGLSLYGYWGTYMALVMQTGSIGGERLEDDCHSELTTISSLNKLSKTTKLSVKYLNLNNNKITSLNGIEGFINVETLRLGANNIVSLQGIEKLSKLRCLNIESNFFQDISELKDITTLRNVMLRKNLELIDLSPVVVSSSPYIVDAEGCLKLNFSNENFTANENALLNKFKNINVLYIDSKYTLAVLTNQSSITIPTSATETEIMNGLKNNTACSILNFNGNTSISNDKIQELIKSMPNLRKVYLNNTNLTDLNFCNEATYLRGIEFYNTAVTDILPLLNCTSLGSVGFNNSSIKLWKGTVNADGTKTYTEEEEEYNNKIVTLLHQIYNHRQRPYIGCIDYQNQLAKLENLQYLCMYRASSLDLSDTSIKELCFESGSSVTVPATFEKVYSVYNGTIITANKITNLKSFGGYGGCYLRCSDVGTVFDENQNGGYYGQCTDTTGSFASIEGSLGDWVGSFEYAPSNSREFNSSLLSVCINCNYFRINRIARIDRLDGTDFANVTRDFIFEMTNSNVMTFKNVNSATNLVNLDLSNNSISDLSFFADEKLRDSKLEKLILKSNNVSNYVSFTEGDEEKTLKTCDFLGTFPKLNYVDLSGNKDVTDFSYFENNGWTKVSNGVYKKDN